MLLTTIILPYLSGKLVGSGTGCNSTLLECPQGFSTNLVDNSILSSSGEALTQVMAMRITLYNLKRAELSGRHLPAQPQLKHFTSCSADSYRAHCAGHCHPLLHIAWAILNNALEAAGQVIHARHCQTPPPNTDATHICQHAYQSHHTSTNAPQATMRLSSQPLLSQIKYTHAPAHAHMAWCPAYRATGTASFPPCCC